MLETHFKLNEHGTTIRTEIVAGLTTFLTMAYILLVNPDILSAAGMDTRELKKEFGKELSFSGGGCDTQEILPRGTPDQVRDEVKRRIDDLAPGGGFLFNPVHNIQMDVPPENVEAMWETVMDYGKY